MVQLQVNETLVQSYFPLSKTGRPLWDYFLKVAECNTNALDADWWEMFAQYHRIEKADPDRIAAEIELALQQNGNKQGDVRNRLLTMVTHVSVRAAADLRERY